MRRIITIVCVAIFAVLTSTAALVSADLNEEQQKLQAEIEHSLVAPCCWNMTVDHHDSQAAREVRANITKMVLAGKTKKEILDYFSSPEQYGERILAEPSSKSLLGKMAYWLIPAAFIFGGFIVYLSVLRLTRKPSRSEMRHSNKVKGEKPAPKKTKSDGDNSYWDELLEKELKQLD